MENTITNQKIKVSIGCRVTQEMKDKLLKDAKEKEYNSFSQYLEELICNSEPQSFESNDSAELSEVDLDNIEVRLDKLFDEKVKLIGDALSVSSKGELDEFLNWFLTTLGFDDESLQLVKQQLLKMDSDIDKLIMALAIPIFGKDIHHLLEEMIRLVVKPTADEEGYSDYIGHYSKEQALNDLKR